MNGVNETPQRDAPFKVIIVGAGVGGLTLAHCLHKTGIDYLVLDKHPVAPAWGASITIHPLGSRILHQLGCLDALDAKCTPMHQFWNRGPDGKNYLCEPFFDQINKRNGYLTYTLERRAFLQTLYETMPDQSKVIEGARVSDIVEDSGRIKVVLTDGTVHEGDLAVGTDGVHSAVRDIMWQKAHQLSPGLITVQEKQAMKTTYNCLVGVAPMQPGLGTEDMTSVSGDKFSFLFLTQPDSIFFIVHCKLPNNQVITYPNRARYTAADAEAKAAQLADCPISDTLVFGDIWKSRIRGHLVSLEEGVLSHWFYGRTVLCGDSAHKVTPNAAFGGSMAIESAVVLANELNAMVKLHPNKKPSDTEVRIALQRYQDTRIPRVKEVFDVSWMLTRLQAFDGWPMYIIQRWILPLVGLDAVARNVAKLCSEAPKLNYVPFQEKSGTLPWKQHKDQMTHNASRGGKAGKVHGLNRLVVPVVLSTLIFYSAVLWVLAGKFVRVPPAVASTIVWSWWRD